MQQSTPELLSYIREQLAAGFTRDVLHATLEKAGWSVSAIDEAFMIMVAEEKSATETVEQPQQLDTTDHADINMPIHSVLDQMIQEDVARPHDEKPMQPIEKPVAQTPLQEYQQPISKTEQQASIADAMQAMPIEPMAAQALADQEEPVMMPEKHTHRWWQAIIIVLLIVVVLALILLILHTLNVYDALAIEVPSWADAASNWVQSLFSK